MKGYVRIGGAFLVGIVVILGAFYLRAHQTEKATSNHASVIAVPRSIREPVAPTDTDGDGVMDWEENLQAQVFEAIATPTTTDTSNESYEPPTTLTGRFSEAFLQSYLEGKIALGDPEAEMSADDRMNLVNDAVQAIEKNATSKLHTSVEIATIPTTNESVRTYGNQIGEILNVTAVGAKNELLILGDALKASDPKLLEPLAIHRDGYATMISEALILDVPDTLVKAHVALLNALEAILTDIEAMRVVFTDPLYSLARVNQYQKDAQFLFSALQRIHRILGEAGIIYTHNEPGVFLNTFES